MQRNLRTLLGASAAISALVAAAPALAQSSGNSDTTVGEVIVTAQKRSESVQQVPASITALNSEMLETRGVSQVEDLRFLVPSLQVGKLVGNTNLTIRGIGLNLVVAAGPPAVAVHVDGVYQSIAGMGDLAQIDLERVEVLRGPQGTLYGRNANAGVVNFITRAPTDQLEGYVLGRYASYDDGRLQGVVNVPFSDRVRARAVIDYTSRGKGFVRNVLPGGQDINKGTTLSGRLRVDVDISENLSLSLVGAALTSSGPFDSFQLQGVSTVPTFVGALNPQEPRRTAVNDPVNTDVNYSFGAATLTWNVGDFQLKSISGWQRHSYDHVGDDDGVSFTLFPVRRNYLTSSFTQELNASGSVGPVDMVVGGFFLDFDQEVDIFYTFPAGISILPPGSRQYYQVSPLKNTSQAAFADVTWNMTDRLRLIGGVRVSHDSMKITQYNYLGFGPTAAPVVTCNHITTEVEFDSTTPRLGAQFDLSSSANVYATWSKGFKVGGFNRNQCGKSYNPEEITAYETGIKSRLFDNTLTLNVSAFYYDYTNLQLAQQVGLAQQITNAAAAVVKGLEVESVWRPDDYWTINASITLLDAKYTSFINQDPLAPALGFQDLSGNPLNDAPRDSINFGVAYRTDPLSFGPITLRADVAQRSKVTFREFDTPINGQAGYTILNLQAVWDSPDEKYRVRVFANNVTDEAYLTSLQAGQANGSRYITWGAPRQVGVEFKAKF